MRFIHQLQGWPCLRWDAAEIEDELSAASFELGKFSGRLNAIGFNLQQEAVCEALSSEILQSAAIEGERLNRDDVRSSVNARRCGFIHCRRRFRKRRIPITKSWNAPSAVR